MEVARPRPIDLLVSHANVVTGLDDPAFVPDAAIAVDAGRIVEVGPTEALCQRFAATRTLDAAGKFAFPGLVNTHTHLFQTFFKGLGDGLQLLTWTRAITVPGLLQMSPEDCYLAAMVGCLEAIRSGTTTLVDYMYPHPDPAIYDALLRALIDSGIRGVVGRGIADLPHEGWPRDGYPPELVQPLDDALADCERLLGRCAAEGQGRVTFALTPPNVRSLTPEALRAMRAFADRHGVLISLHICETAVDDVIVMGRHNRTAVEFLDDVGFLAPDLIGVHCVAIGDDAIARFARQDVKVSHNPVSNMYLGTGVAPVRAMRAAGVTVSLATDGAASNNSQDMLEVLKTAATLQRVAAGDPAIVHSRDILAMATRAGAVSVGRPDELGALAPGYRADLFLADFGRAKSTPVHDPVATLVFSAGQDAIDTVVVDGRIVLEGGSFAGLDEFALLTRAQQAARHLANRAHSAEVLANCWAPPPAPVLAERG